MREQVADLLVILNTLSSNEQSDLLDLLDKQFMSLLQSQQQIVFDFLTQIALLLQPLFLSLLLLQRRLVVAKRRGLGRGLIQSHWLLLLDCPGPFIPGNRTSFLLVFFHRQVPGVEQLLRALFSLGDFGLGVQTAVLGPSLFCHNLILLPE